MSGHLLNKHVPDGHESRENSGVSANSTTRGGPTGNNQVIAAPQPHPRGTRLIARARALAVTAGRTDQPPARPSGLGGGGANGLAATSAKGG